jgi:hypothetical protein
LRGQFIVALISLFSFQNCARNGKDGKDAVIPPSALGPSCSLQNFDDHAILSCVDGSSFTLASGTNGSNGANGTSCTVVQASNGAQITCSDGTTGFVSNGKDGKDASSCSVVKTSNGAKIQCPDGSSVDITNGTNGTNGSSCSVSDVSAGKVLLQCTDGTFAIIENGKNGLNGTNGSNGADGSNGSSCSTVQTSNGAQIQCNDGTFAVISNGKDGKNATSTATGYEIVKVIDPCGTKTAFDEVLLQFANGDLLAHYSDGIKEHFTLIPPGSYRTTDGTNCNFTVTSDKKVNW